MYLVVYLRYYLGICFLELYERYDLTQRARLNEHAAITVTETAREIMFLALVGSQGVDCLHGRIKLRVRHPHRARTTVLLQLAHSFAHPRLLLTDDAVHDVVGDEGGRDFVVGMGAETEDVRVDVFVS